MDRKKLILEVSKREGKKESQDIFNITETVFHTLAVLEENGYDVPKSKTKKKAKSKKR